MTQADVPNLADPDVEPQDDALVDLSRRAFAHVPAARAAALARVRAEIDAARVEVLRSIAASRTDTP